MGAYWFAFVAVALGSFQFSGKDGARRARLALIAAAAALALMIGLRFDVGGDWLPYLEIYDRIYHLNLGEALGQSDAGYALLNWIAAQLGFDVWFVNLCCATIVMIGLSRLCAEQPNPFLALLIALPYFIIVVAMGYTRQATAIGLILIALTMRSPNRLAKTIFWIGVAAMLHRTAILALPIALIPTIRRNVVVGVAGAVVFAGVFVFALRDQADTMVANYVQGSYDSSGALIRVAMNVVAAALFLKFRRRLGFDPFQQSYWTTCSVLAVASLIALAVSPSSSGIDRLSLFLLPLQIVVLARLPYLHPSGRVNRELLVGIVAYCAAVLGTFLIAGDHAQYWLPYRTVVGQDMYR